jgi:glucose-1-phosphate thymidylyltransferase
VVYVSNSSAEQALPTPVINLALRSLVNAGISRCIVSISDRKPELLRYLGDGSEFGLQLAFVHQPTPTGLSSAVDLAFPWVREAYSCLLLPDTIVDPFDALTRVVNVAQDERADLVLGVFPTDTPEQLGPVHFDRNRRILEVLDKPVRTDLRNTWSIAVWSPAFSDFLHERAYPAAEPDLPLGSVFNLAVHEGMSAYAVWFTGGSVTDIGSFAGLSRMLQSIDHASESLFSGR